MGRPTLFSDLPGSTDPFDQAYGPDNKNPISPYDLATSDSTAFGYALEGAMDLNPFPMAVRQLRVLKEDMFGGTERVSAEDARKENAERGFDLKVPDGGISRYELDMLQYFKQREIHRNKILMGSTGLTGVAAQFAGGLAGTVADPINIASMFIPIVPEARVAAMLARQGASMLGRAGVRAGVGAVEGAVGAALIEPITYAGAQLQQAEYSVADSFVNVMFGGVAGGGLHMLGGGVYDYRGARAAEGVDALMSKLRRDDMARAPDEVHLEALRQSVDAAENDLPPRATQIFDAAAGRETAANPASAAQSSQGFIPEWTGGRVSQPMEGVAVVPGQHAYAIDKDGTQYNVTEMGHQGLIDHGDTTTFMEKGIVLVSHYVGPDGKNSIAFSSASEVTPTQAQAILRQIKESGVSLRDMMLTRDTNPEGRNGFSISERPEGADPVVLASMNPEDVNYRTILGSAQFRVDAAPTARASEQVTVPLDDPRNVAVEMEKADSWAQEAKRDGAAFDPKEAAKDFPDEETYAAQLDALKAHIQSLKNRGLLTAELEAMIKEGDDAAMKMEQEAEAYEAAVICEAEL